MRIRFEKLTASNMVQKCAMFDENRKFLIFVTSVRPWRIPFICTFIYVRGVYKNVCPSVCLNIILKSLKLSSYNHIFKNLK